MPDSLLEEQLLPSPALPRARIRWRALRPGAFLALSPEALLVLLLQAVMVVAGHFRRIETITLDGPEILALCLSCLPALALFQLLHLGLHHHRGWLVAGNLLLLAVYALLTIYHSSARAAFDYALVGNDPLPLLGRELARLLQRAPDRVALLGAGLALLLLLALELRWRLLSRWRVAPRRLAPTLTSAVLLLGLILAPVHSHDELTAAVRTVIRFHTATPPSTARLAARGIKTDADFPYHRRQHVRRPNAAPGSRAAPPLAFAAADSARLPNIFIVALESFNASFVGTRTPDGQEVTPVFNRLARRGLLVDRFYGNSVQTARGHVALLCSILPSIWRIILADYPELRLRCLPEMLRAKGYRTLYLTGHADLSFHNTGAGMRRLGFEEVQGLDSRLAGPVSPDLEWGWGYQDDLLYRRALELVDRLQGGTARLATPEEPRPTVPATEAPPTSATGQPPAGHDQPVFAFLATLSHHTHFDQVPRRLWRIHPHARTHRERFARSLNVADGFLEELFAQLARRPGLRDSMVILVGDHGFPAEDQGSHDNEIGAREENFRTPLLLLWEGRLPPRVLRDQAYSQVDLAPTILDLLGLETDHHFLGRSILEPGSERVAHLIQPYDGLWLGAVRYPLKYVHRLRTGQERLFDLSHDPGERHNLLRAFRGHRELRELREEVAAIYLNQRLLDENRVWPPGR